MRWLRSWWQETPPELMAYQLGTVLVFLQAVMLLARHPQAAEYLGVVAIATFIAGAYVWIVPHLVSFLYATEKDYLRTIGRWLVHLAAAWLALALAHASVGRALGLPPGDFQITVGFVAFFLYVPALLAVLGLSSSVVASLHYMKFLFLMLFDLLGVIRRPTFKEVLTVFGRCVGLFFIAIVLVDGHDVVVRLTERADPVVRSIAIQFDFHRMDNYPGVQPGERVKLHENGVVSFVAKQGDTQVIRVRKLPE